MSFCAAINCMDGRVQVPVIDYLTKRLGVKYVDSITEPGPVKMLAENANGPAIASICRRLDISINKHRSKAIGIAAHHDCAGNPLSKEEQHEQLRKAIANIKARYPGIAIIGLWVDDKWAVEEI